MDAYRPTVTPQQVEAILRWHERAYAEGKVDAAHEQVFEYLGLTIVVPPDVMPMTPMSHLLGETVLAEVRPGEQVLDMGTGNGVNAILAATRGAAVVAVDINPRALDAAAPTPPVTGWPSASMCGAAMCSRKSRGSST
jgi:release factor glutamine methyltransferase